MVIDLRAALQYGDEKDRLKKLEKQADALDTAFRRLLSNADTTYEHGDACEIGFTQYAAAFKAQDLFCRTVRAIKSLEEKEKPKNQKP